MKFFKNKLAVVVILLSVLFASLIGFSLSGSENDNKTSSGKSQGFFGGVNNKLSNLVGSVVDFSDVKKENEKLKEENAKLQKMALESDSIKNENDRLNADLDYKNSKKTYNYVVCNIINGPDKETPNSYVIDKGEAEGIKKGMAVITPMGLVGQVVYTSSHWSNIATIADENISVAAILDGVTEDSNGDGEGMVKGYKAGSNDRLAQMTYISLKSTIKKGDKVVTSNVGYIYPKGISIGEVTDITEDKAKLMKVATIKPYVDFTKLQEVMVVVPKDSSVLQYKEQ